eukprot:2555561-Rhodomonas_salina.1
MTEVAADGCKEAGEEAEQDELGFDLGELARVHERAREAVWKALVDAELDAEDGAANTKERTLLREILREARADNQVGHFEDTGAMTDASKRAAKGLFAAIDTDGSGALSREEVQAALEGHEERFVADILCKVGDEGVDFEGFSRLVLPLLEDSRLRLAMTLRRRERVQQAAAQEQELAQLKVFVEDAREQVRMQHEAAEAQRSAEGRFAGAASAALHAHAEEDAREEAPAQPAAPLRDDEEAGAGGAATACTVSSAPHT